MSGKYDEYGVNINNIDMFYSKKMPVCDKLIEKRIALHWFTSNDYISHILYHTKGYKLVRLDSKKLKMCYKGTEIEFSKLSDLLDGDYEGAQKEKKELLNIRRRLGKCHVMTLSFLGSDIGDTVVTGYVDSTAKNRRIIHSWLETNNKVIDYTCNLVIDKDIYYLLWQPEILSVINREDFKADYEKEFMHNLGCKFYCLFREELYRDGLITNGRRKIKINEQ